MKESAFTSKANGLANQLVSLVGVSIAHDVRKGIPDNPNVSNCKAIWDTGATASVITKSLVEKLKLLPIGKTKVRGVTGVAEKNRYLIDLYLPNKVIMTSVSVTESDELTGDFEVLIGMDIIKLGDFAVSNFKGKTQFTFRLPSMEEIDFVKDIHWQKHKKVSDKKHYNGRIVGPNEKCPCGSKKKFKKCHGR